MKSRLRSVRRSFDAVRILGSEYIQRDLLKFIVVLYHRREGFWKRCPGKKDFAEPLSCGIMKCKSFQK